jgi:hypothetical protein
MDTAAPVGQIVICERVDDGAGCDNVHVVVAVQLTFNNEGAKKGKSPNSGHRGLVVEL